MIQEHRKKVILQELDNEISLSIRSLSSQLGVNRETIRKDIKELAEENLVRQVRGGVMKLDANEAPLIDRITRNSKGKMKIAQRALEMIQPGATVILDSGSSTRALAKILPKIKDLKIITNDLMIASELRTTFSSVRLLGGRLSLEEEAIFGKDAEQMLKSYTADYAFIGIGGLSEAMFFTDFTQDGLSLRTAMIAASKKTFALADKTKIGKHTPFRHEQPNQFDGVITDADLPKNILQKLSVNSIRVYRVEDF